ncbi:MAG: MBL fold metallo-hydrolase [Coriobacteriales bacterium]|jgi:glyoxylase-like metal-dependent hydrolase (beta-lactamase superfamily II)|nr:MBL fold metallo-hydrolase [Coriobacteriales bacterium]
MEIRNHYHGAGKLWTRTCISKDSGFRVASVIVVGNEHTVLIDTQWTLANAHRVLAEILEIGKPLQYIYLSHAHPDHYFGTKVFTDAFPEAKVYADPDDIAVVTEQFLPKLDHWQSEIGILNCPHEAFDIIPLPEAYLMLDGERIEMTYKVWGDLKWNSRVYIPSIKTVICSDIVFSEAHPFTCEVSPRGRKKWLEELETIRALGAEVIIPGHAKEDMPFDETGLNFTRDYLIATDEVLAQTQDEHAFFHEMETRFFDAKLRKSNAMNANVILGGLEWNWNDTDVDE